MKRFFCLWIIVGVFHLGIIACNDSPKIENRPNFTLSQEFGIDSTELVYQYYQQFGFSDLCEDLRFVTKQLVEPSFKNVLPLSPEHLAIIAEFPNKGDLVREKIVIGNREARSVNQDIELDFLEYIPDSTLIFQLQEGSYEIVQSDTSSILKIYDTIHKLLYIEVHRCDGI